MTHSVNAAMENRDNAADDQPAADDTVSENNRPSMWKRHRLPILLGVVAALLYMGSIIWMVFGRGQVS